MKAVKTIRLYYLLYTAYTLYVLLISDYDFWAVLLGLGSIWLVFTAFQVGFSVTSFNERREIIPVTATESPRRNFLEGINEWRAGTYIVHAVLCFMSAVLSAQFYTGKSLIGVIQAILQDRSLYSEYQLYFKTAGIASFSIEKIIYILMLTYLTVMLLAGYVGILIPHGKKRFSQIFFLAVASVSHLYFGLARGTNFEMYILFVIFLYALLNKKTKNSGQTSLSKKSILLIIGIGIIMVVVFKLVIEARGYVFTKNISYEIKYNADSIISKMFPTITDMVLAVFAYLGFGVSAIGFFIKDITFGSFSGLFASFIPFGHEIVLDTTIEESLRSVVNLGVKWVPDYLQFIGWLGMPLLLIFSFMLGVFLAKAQSGRVSSISAELVGFVIFLQMISFPIGNFILTSTPITLTAAFALVMYFIDLIIKRTNEPAECHAVNAVEAANE